MHRSSGRRLAYASDAWELPAGGSIIPNALLKKPVVLLVGKAALFKTKYIKIVLTLDDEIDESEVGMQS